MVSYRQNVNITYGSNTVEPTPVDTSTPLPVQDKSTTTLPDGSYVQQVDTSRPFADNFGATLYGTGGAALTGAAAITALAANWTVPTGRSTLTTMTVTLNNGNLAIGMGTTNGDELFLLGKAGATIPANLIATLLMSQRIAGNEVRIGYAEVDASGNLVTNPNLAGFPRNMAAMLFNGTNAQSQNIGSIAEGQATEKQILGTGMNTTALQCDAILECRPEDVTMMTQGTDAAASRGSICLRASSVVGSPGARYAPFLWFRNTSAPATNTTVTVYRVYSGDIQELQAEIISRGSTAANQSLPVSTVSTVVTTINGVAANTTTNGASFFKLISAATTNAISVKTSAGRIVGGRLRNNSAGTKYVKFYNKASAPTVGTDVPVFFVELGAGESMNWADAFDTYGAYFSTGIAFATTGLSADTDTTAVAAGDITINLNYV